MRQITTLIVLALALASFSFANLTPLAPVGPASVIEMHQDLFRALDSGDADRATGFLHRDMFMNDKWRKRPCQLFITDTDGSVQSSLSYADSRKLMQDLARRFGPSSGCVKTTIRALSSECTEPVSYAVLEIERKYRLGNKSWTEKFISTSLITHNSGWKLTHWHLSPAASRS